MNARPTIREILRKSIRQGAGSAAGFMCSAAGTVLGGVLGLGSATVLGGVLSGRLGDILGLGSATVLGLWLGCVLSGRLGDRLEHKLDQGLGYVPDTGSDGMRVTKLVSGLCYGLGYVVGATVGLGLAGDMVGVIGAVLVSGTVGGTVGGICAGMGAVCGRFIYDIWADLLKPELTAHVDREAPWDQQADAAFENHPGLKRAQRCFEYCARGMRYAEARAADLIGILESGADNIPARDIRRHYWQLWRPLMQKAVMDSLRKILRQMARWMIGR